MKTDDGWVIEFQNSYLKPEERRARNAFYHPKLVWVVNGLKRKRDRPQFDKAYKEGKEVGESSIVRIGFWDWDESRILKEWAESKKNIFFDFGQWIHFSLLVTKVPFQLL